MFEAMVSAKPQSLSFFTFSMHFKYALPTKSQHELK